MITVRAFLSSPLLQGYGLLAGGEGLDREVRAVSVADSPLAEKMLAGREIILTTGYLFEGDERRFHDFAANLASSDCAALGIKIGRYWDEVPAKVIELADENGLPIFSVPPEVAWSSVITQFHDMRLDILSDESLFIKDVTGLNQMLLLGSHDIDTARNYFLNIIGIPAMIVDSGYNVLASNDLPGCDVLIDYATSLVDGKTYEGKERPEHGVHVGGYWIFEILLNRGKRLLLASRSQLVSRNVMQLLQAMYTMATQRIGRRMELATKMEQFIRLVTSESSDSEIREMAASLDLFQAHDQCMVIISGADHAKIYKRFADLVRKRRGGVSWEAFGLGRMHSKEHIVFCRTLSGQAKAVEALLSMRGLLGELQFDGAQCKISVGSIGSSPRSIRESYHAARAAQRISAILWPELNIVFSRDTEVLTELQNYGISLDEIEYLQQSILTFDACATLEAFLRSGSIKKAAQSLFIHENTMRYRIQKISGLLSLNLNDTVSHLYLLTQIELLKLRNYAG